jgi:hypothetical protein
MRGEKGKATSLLTLLLGMNTSRLHTASWPMRWQPPCYCSKLDERAESQTALPTSPSIMVLLGTCPCMEISRVSIVAHRNIAATKCILALAELLKLPVRVA